MRDTVRPISDKVLRELSARAHRLTTTIESATRAAANSAVRREGARFGEVIEEWLDDLKALIEAQDAAAGERLESFEQRLAMAERKVDHWNLPPTLSVAPSARRKPAKHTTPEPELEIEETAPWYVDDMEEIPMSSDTPKARTAAPGKAGKKSAA
jgi:hypothetical protein